MTMTMPFTLDREAAALAESPPAATAPPAAASITMPQLAQLSGTSVADLQDLVDSGVLSPHNPDSQKWTFALPEVMVLQRAEALRQDLALDVHAFALAVMLLKQITALEWQLQAAEAQIVALNHQTLLDHPAN